MSGTEHFLRIGIDGSSAITGGRVVNRALGEVDTAATTTNRNIQNVENSLSKIGSNSGGLRSVKRNLDDCTSSTKSWGAMLDSIEDRLIRIGISTAVFVAIGRSISAVKTITQETLQYLGTIETATLGIASSFLVSGKFIDNTTGKVLSGQASMKASMAMSNDVIEQLKVANMQTIATLDQLIVAYQVTLPVAMAKGFNKNMVMDFTLAMVQAAGAIGLPFDQMAEETRSLLTGTINPRTSRIATVLGLRNEDIAVYKGNAQGLFDFLMGRLEGFRIAGIESQKTWAGLWSNFKDISKQGTSFVFQGMFEGIKSELTSLMSSIVTVNTETKKINWNPEFVQGAKDLGKTVSSVFSAFVEGAKWVYEHAKAIGTVIALYTAYKVAGLATSLMLNMVTTSAEASAVAETQRRVSIMAVFDAETVRLTQNKVLLATELERAQLNVAVAQQEQHRAQYALNGLVAEKALQDSKIKGLALTAETLTMDRASATEMYAHQVQVAEGEIAKAAARANGVRQHLALIATEMEALQAKGIITKADYAFEKELRYQQMTNISKLIVLEGEQGMAESRLSAIRKFAIADLRTIVAAEKVAIDARNMAVKTSAILGMQVLVGKEQEILSRIATKAALDAEAASVVRLTEAQELSLIATRAMTAAKGLFNSALTALGGPLGAITTLLMLGSTAWMIWGNKAKDAVDQPDFIKTIEGQTKAIREQIQELKEAERLKSGKSLDGSGSLSSHSMAGSSNDTVQALRNEEMNSIILENRIKQMGGRRNFDFSKPVSTISGTTETPLMALQRAADVSIGKIARLKADIKELARYTNNRFEADTPKPAEEEAWVYDKSAYEAELEKFNNTKRAIEDAYTKAHIADAKNETKVLQAELKGRFDGHLITELDYLKRKHALQQSESALDINELEKKAIRDARAFEVADASPTYNGGVSPFPEDYLAKTQAEVEIADSFNNAVTRRNELLAKSITSWEAVHTAESKSELDGMVYLDETTKAIDKQASALRGLDKEYKTLTNSIETFEASQVGVDSNTGIVTNAKANQIAIANNAYENEMRNLKSLMEEEELKQSKTVAWGEQYNAIELNKSALRTKAYLLETKHTQDLAKANSTAYQGMSEAIAKYGNEAMDIGKQIESTFTNAFKSMEDALVTFIQTGSLSFKNMANSIIADISRIVVKQALMQAGGVIGPALFGTAAVAGVAGAAGTPATAGLLGAGGSAAVMATMAPLAAVAIGTAMVMNYVKSDAWTNKSRDQKIIAGTVSTMMPVLGIVDWATGGGLFGTSWKANKSGMDLSVQGGEATGSTWTEYKKKGAFFSGNKYKTEWKSLTEKQDAELQSAFLAINEGMYQKLAVLEIGGEKMRGIQSKIVLSTRKSTNAFAEYTDKMMLAYMPSLSRKETGDEVYARNAVAIKMANSSSSIIRNIGRKQIDLVVRDLKNEDYVLDKETYTQAGERILSSLMALKNFMASTGNAIKGLTVQEGMDLGQNAYKNIISKYGGKDSTENIAAFNSASSTYSNSALFTEEEKAANSLASATLAVTTVFDGAAIAIPKTNTEFKSLVTSTLNLALAGGEGADAAGTLYNQLIAVSGAFAMTTDTTKALTAAQKTNTDLMKGMLSLYGEEAVALQRQLELADITDESTRAIKQYVWAKEDEIKAQQKATAAAKEAALKSISLAETILQAKKNIETASPDLTAQGAYEQAKTSLSNATVENVGALAEAFVTASRNYNASSKQFQDDKTAALAKLTFFEPSAVGTLSDTEKQLALLKEISEAISLGDSELLKALTIQYSVLAIETGSAATSLIAAQIAMKNALEGYDADGKLIMMGVIPNADIPAKLEILKTALEGKNADGSYIISDATARGGVAAVYNQMDTALQAGVPFDPKANGIDTLFDSLSLLAASSPLMPTADQGLQKFFTTIGGLASTTIPSPADSTGIVKFYGTIAGKANTEITLDTTTGVPKFYTTLAGKANTEIIPVYTATGGIANFYSSLSGLAIKTIVMPSATTGVPQFYESIGGLATSTITLPANSTGVIKFYADIAGKANTEIVIDSTTGVPKFYTTLAGKANTEIVPVYNSTGGITNFYAKVQTAAEVGISTTTAVANIQGSTGFGAVKTALDSGLNGTGGVSDSLVDFNKALADSAALTAKGLTDFVQALGIVSNYTRQRTEAQDLVSGISNQYTSGAINASQFNTQIGSALTPLNNTIAEGKTVGLNNLTSPIDPRVITTPYGSISLYMPTAAENDIRMKNIAIKDETKIMEMALGVVPYDVNYNIYQKSAGVMDIFDIMTWSQIRDGSLKWSALNIPAFAKGGISNQPSIFGEAGPEAAVPLPDGRSIPVTLSGGNNAETIAELKEQNRLLTALLKVSQAGLIRVAEATEKTAKSTNSLEQSATLQAAA